MEPAHLVKYNHVEWSGGCAYVIKSTHMEAAFVRTAVHHTVDQPAIAMEREDDIDVACKHRVEGNIVQAVRMIVRTHQHVEIDDIYDADFYARHALLQQPGSGAGLDRRNIARARQDNVGVLSTIICRKMPDRCALRAVSKRFIKRKPLQFRLFSAGHNIDVVPTAQAVIEYVQQAV